MFYYVSLEKRYENSIADYMKKISLILICTFGFLFAQAQQVMDLRTGIFKKEKSSTTIPERDIEKLEDGYMVTYTFENALLQPDELFSGTMFWKMDGFGLNQMPGDPSTLVREDMISIPSGYIAIVEVVDSVYCDYNYELTPARQPLIDSNNEVYTKQNVLAIRPYDGFKPSTIVSQCGSQSYRGHYLCIAKVSPIQYNKNTKTVRAYSKIKYKVTFIPNHECDSPIIRTDPKHLSCEDNFLSNNVIGGRLEETNLERTESISQADVRDYLILSTNKYSEAVNRFAQWKRLLGFNVHIILKNDWTSTSVKDTVTDAYADLPALYYLLIIGDNNDVPAQVSSLDMSHITDFHYGSIDGDYIPDIYCGRLSVSTSDEAINVVEKIIGYEKLPPINPNFYDNVLHCAYFQDRNYDSYADRRFAQTSEDVRTYMMLQGKSIQRVYYTEPDVTPLYWNKGSFSNGEAIPDELKKPGFAWDGNYIDINNAINSGVLYVLHRDHGAVWGWGDPRYIQQRISNLSNGNLLPIVFSMNCLTGEFNKNCFAETFLRKPNGGCVAIYAASDTSYTGFNDALTTGMFDAIWPNPGLSIHIPHHNNTISPTPTPTYTLGQILGQGMVRLSETYGFNSYFTKYTKEIFHCFGDPSMKIYTQCPTAFTNVIISRNESSISVNLGDSVVARITAYNPATGEVQSFVGNFATITTSNPEEDIICISAHNRIPYIQSPDIMYIQNTNITGTFDESHDIIKVGNHVTTAIEAGDVTTSNAEITLNARKVVLDDGIYISEGSSLKTVDPL